MFIKRVLFFTLLIAITALTLTSCKKSNNDDDGDSTYYIRGKKDGNAFTFSANAMAKITDFTSSGGFISLTLFANAEPNAASLEGLNLSINFFEGQQPVPGTYSEDSNGSDYVAAGVYNPGSASIVWSAGIHYPTAKALKINILSKSSTEITGTFEGAFYKQDVSIPAVYDTYITFTEGEFKLPIK